MERVLGIGGYFLRAADPAALSAWYRDCLGLDADDNGLWRQEPGPTVFATFASDTDYFGSPTQNTMLNFRVRDLEARENDKLYCAGGFHHVHAEAPRFPHGKSANGVPVGVQIE